MLGAAPLVLLLSLNSHAAPHARITSQVDTNRLIQVQTPLNRKLRPELDRGAVDAGMPINYMVVMFKPSAAQQAELDQLLIEQLNPSSANYHKWLTPEDFGNRFGLNNSDLSKVTAWLASQGLKVERQARGNNWVAFSGSAGQVSAALHTPIHRFEIDGKMRFSNTVAPSVPEAFAEVTGGFLGLTDMPLLESQAIQVNPAFTTGTTHYLVPEDWSTIYNVAPLYAAGLDGTGQSIVIVGQSAPVLSDLRAFKTRYNLPANDPKVLLYGGTDPGVNGALVETDLDLEWAGAIAPRATINYVYGQDAFIAVEAAVDLNLSPIMSISFAGCELLDADPGFRVYFQQGAAQGISILASSGDTGAAGCDQGSTYATGGPTIQIPAAFPEVTAVGGTQFMDATGNFWNTKNSANGGSALSYIPEAAWNESGAYGLISGGGGASQFYSRPPWQQGVGLPADNARYIPDISFTAALHDAYNVVYQGSVTQVGGTSASSPSFAGVVALLNQYQVAKGFQAKPGLGNLNPQLYRLAQAVPSVFHDITVGDNIVACLQASPGCGPGSSFGYKATVGYDPATGLGSADANALVTQWNTATSAATVDLILSSNSVDVNSSVTLTAIVTPNGGTQPTGTIDFMLDGTPMGTVPLIPAANNTAAAQLTFPVYNYGSTGTAIASVLYSGNSVYSSAGTTKQLKITSPTGAAGVLVQAPTAVGPDSENAQGLSYPVSFTVSFTLVDVGNTASVVTAFSIDGQPQTVSQYFPSPTLKANGTLQATVVLYDVPAATTKEFSVSGIDVKGNTWQRSFSVLYVPSIGNGGFVGEFLLTAFPLNTVQNIQGPSSCQWPVQIAITDISGSPSSLYGLLAGGVDLSSSTASIFGTNRLASYGSLRGTICENGIQAPASMPILVELNNGVTNEITVSFGAAPATPVTLSGPAAVSLSAADATKPAQSTFNLNLSDASQPWSLAVTPNNVTSGWLGVSPRSGVGPAKITVTASGAGLGVGAYLANLVFQSPSAQPLNIPVTYVLGVSATGPTIASLGNAGSHQATASPGMIAEIYGSNLSTATTVLSLQQNPDVSSSTSFLPVSSGGVSVTVNGYPAPLLYVSPKQINIQIPYYAGAGPAVVAVNNNGQVGAFPFTITPSAPGIMADAASNILPAATAAPGGIATLYFTGAGDVSPALRTGLSLLPSVPVSSLPVPRLPVSITVGGVQAFNQFIGQSAGLVGVMQANFYVPLTVPAGMQPVVVTVNGVASPAAFLQVAAAPTSANLQ
jgi:uncharacterized protein (TIGR03437 family)